MNEEQERVASIWGNCFIVIALVVLLIVCSGCVSKTEWYESGQMKSKREGFIEWSDAPGKNMPLSNISVIGK